MRPPESITASETSPPRSRAYLQASSTASSTGIAVSPTAGEARPGAADPPLPPGAGASRSSSGAATRSHHAARAAPTGAAWRHPQPVRPGGAARRLRDRCRLRSKRSKSGSGPIRMASSARSPPTRVLCPVRVGGSMGYEPMRRIPPGLLSDCDAPRSLDMLLHHKVRGVSDEFLTRAIAATLALGRAAIGVGVWLAPEWALGALGFDPRRSGSGPAVAMARLAATPDLVLAAEGLRAL